MGVGRGGGGGGSVGRSVEGQEGGRTPCTYKVITNTHATIKWKLIMGNIIVCPAGPKNFKY